MDKSIRFTFLGGAGTVTGSKTLLEAGSYKILIDCGMFQGLKALRILNWEPFPIDPESIDVVILTHAHLDHVGSLPLLVKQGYSNPIYCTAPTYDIAKVILLDSAKIQEEEAEKANREGYSSHTPAKPLYTVEDVHQCLSLFVTYPIGKKIDLFEHLSFKFIPSGHILGSALVKLNVFEKELVFSGDLGRSKPLIQDPPASIQRADVLVLESTYGDRLHEQTNLEESFAHIINDTIVFKKGNLIIPSFALERAQELIVLINRMKRKGLIQDVPLYLDSPMATAITDIMLHFPDWHTLTTVDIRDIRSKVHFVQDIKETFSVIEDPTPKIIIAGSGMISGGRVLEYLKKHIGDLSNTVLLSGFQAEGTRGRALMNREGQLKIYGKMYDVVAEVKEISGLSGHVDQQEMIDWVSNIKEKPKTIILNHGEPESSKAFALKLKELFPSIDIEIAVMGHVFRMN